VSTMLAEGSLAPNLGTAYGAVLYSFDTTNRRLPAEHSAAPDAAAFPRTYKNSFDPHAEYYAPRHHPLTYVENSGRDAGYFFSSLGVKLISPAGISLALSLAKISSP